MTSAGQRLSIISKSSIRYEGVLSKIDPAENTVSLVSVKMFGTEGRPVSDYVPPKNEVYDYIIFKGSDIKDLTVIDQNKTAQPPQDPAIVSAGKAVPQPKPSGGIGGMEGMGMNANVRNVLGGIGGSIGGGFGGSKPSSSYLQQSQPAASDYEQYNTSKPSAGGYNGDRDRSRYNTRETAREPAQYSGSKGYKGNRENGSKGDSYAKDYSKDYQTTSYTPGYGGYGGQRSKGGDYGSKGDYSRDRDHSGKGGKMSSYSHYGDRDRGYQSHKGGYKGGKDSHKGGKGKGKGKGGKKGNAYASHTGMEFSSGEKASATPATFKDDFDFDKMQEASQQEAKKHQKEAKAQPPAESKYQKENGFFDSLTYDANNREKVEKVEKHAQHDTDCATFGTKTVEDYERKTQSHFRKGGKKGDKGGKGGKGSKGGKSYKGGRNY